VPNIFGEGPWKEYTTVLAGALLLRGPTGISTRATFRGVNILTNDKVDGLQKQHFSKESAEKTAL